ncbi:MAG: peptidylprolyl isomerase [Planctomycetota bacterium]
MNRCIRWLLTLAALASIAGCPTGAPYMEAGPRARVQTTLGEFVIELDPNTAPVTVANFTEYINAGFYDGTLFHRVVPGFVVQGGGYLPGMELKETRPPIRNESFGGLKNERGTVAMARTDDPNSATSQFYINLLNNGGLDATLTTVGYTVFGVVIEGMDVVDAIGAVETTTRDEFSDVPVSDVVIQHVALESGAQTLTPEWETFVQTFETNLRVYLRDAAVSVLNLMLSSR